MDKDPTGESVFRNMKDMFVGEKPSAPSEKSRTLRNIYCGVRFKFPYMKNLPSLLSSVLMCMYKNLFTHCHDTLWLICKRQGFVLNLKFYVKQKYVKKFKYLIIKFTKIAKHHKNNEHTNYKSLKKNNNRILIVGQIKL